MIPNVKKAWFANMIIIVDMVFLNILIVVVMVNILQTLSIHFRIIFCIFLKKLHQVQVARIMLMTGHVVDHGTLVMKVKEIVILMWNVKKVWFVDTIIIVDQDSHQDLIVV